jgi:hypothetical protein
MLKQMRRQKEKKWSGSGRKRRKLGGKEEKKEENLCVHLWFTERFCQFVWQYEYNIEWRDDYWCNSLAFLLWGGG